MAGNTNFPASEDVFSANTPTPTTTTTDTADSTGRKHAERHDDAEAALMAIETYGISNIPHIGASAPTNDALVWIDTDENSIASTIISGDTPPESHDVLWLDTTEEGPATTLAPFLLMGA